jgi:putative flippase GtrA
MKFIKYFFVGGIAAFVDIGLFFLGAGVAQWNYMIVGTVSFTLATLVNYFISVRVVFRTGTRFSRHYELLLVFLVSCAGLVLNQAILYVSISRLAIGLLPAKLLATAGVFLWNYQLRSRFVFAAPRNA